MTRAQTLALSAVYCTAFCILLIDLFFWRPL